MTYIYLLLGIILLIILNYDYLTILQQNHYKNNLMKYYLKKYYKKYLLWLITFILFNLFYTLKIIKKLLLEIYYICIIMFYLINIKKKIIKLKITKRIIRIIIFIIVIDLIFILNKNYLFSYNILLLIYPLINIIILEINKPIEKLINKYYINNAKKIINDNKDIINIAITGSYGKTSTKNIIYQLLKNNYLTVKTPKSYNTLLGVVKTINEKIDSTTQTFIYECAATSPGDIKEIVDVVKPNIAIITDIGYQHLESFKTIENIIKTKFEITENLNFEDTIILNDDNIYIKNKKITNVKNVIRISLIDINKDYYAKINNILPLQITIYKHQKEEITLNTNLLGRHNALNILISYVVLDVLKEKGIKINKQQIKEITKNLQFSPHRLEYKKLNNIHIYDDAYNSNIVGFKNACEVIKLLPYKKIIITPGIVELGKKEKEINEEIAQLIKNTFDEIYIIKNKASESLIKYLKEETINITNSFINAYNECVNKYTEEIAILIENDLPDNYLER